MVEFLAMGEPVGLAEEEAEMMALFVLS